MRWHCQEEELWFPIIQRRARFPGESACRLPALGCGYGCCCGPITFTPNATRRSTLTTMSKSATMTAIVAQKQDCGVEQTMIELSNLTQNGGPWQDLEFLRRSACALRGDFQPQGWAGGAGGSAALRAASFLR